MALNLTHERSYDELPEIVVRLHHAGRWVDAWAVIDTGADITLFDVELMSSLPLLARSRPQRRRRIVGIGRASALINFWTIEVEVIVPALASGSHILVGFARGLAKTTGNLLGRDFLQSAHLGLAHADRRLYLGRADG